MISLYNAQLAVTIGAVLLVYMILVPLVGAGQALLTSWLGDDTPAQDGYLTLNPMAHASPFWICVLVISQLLYTYMPFGFGQAIIVNESNFIGRFARARYMLSLFSNSLMAYLLAVAAFSGLLIMHGVRVVLLIPQQPTLKNIYMLFPDSTSLSGVVTFMLITAFIMASFTAALSFVLNVFQLLQPHLSHYMAERGSGAEIVTFMFLFLVFSFCADPLYKLGIQTVIMLSYKIVTMLGLLA